MEHTELTHAIEAVLFVAAEPLSLAEVRKVFARLWAPQPAEERELRLRGLEPAWEAVRQRWLGSPQGFGLMEVAEGLAFRSSGRFADVLRAMRDERPQRLSKPALETLAIVAYRQPVTKPEVDHIRGVDCGGTLKVLLDRNLVRIVGKREEAGRPLLYGTSRDFLNLFNLGNLTQLPSLREFHELNEDSAAQVQELESMQSLQELSQSAKQLRLDDEPAVAILDEAVDSLQNAESATRDAFAAQGIVLPGQPGQMSDEVGETPPA